MALDIIRHINDNVSLTNAKKTEMLDHICATHGYQEKVTVKNKETGLSEEVDNPETKKQFGGRMIEEQILRWINGWRKTQAEKELTFDELIFE